MSAARSSVGRLTLLLVASFTLVLFGANTAVTAAQPRGPLPTYPSGDAGTTVDPLHYGCGASAPNCGQVGESYGWYNGTNVQLLYTESYYCDHGKSNSPSSGASSGCEAGAPAANGPPTNTVQSSAPLYIPVPLFASPAENVQCPASYTCIDHPATIDLSRLGSAVPSLKNATNVGLPGHDHLLTTRDNGIPEWWNVQVLGVTTPAAYNAVASAKSYSAVKTLQAQGSVTQPIPSNVYLFFQVLPGTVSNAAASNIAGRASAPPGPTPNDNNGGDIESGATINNLRNNCYGGGPNCENVGYSQDWIGGQDATALYTEQFFCDRSVSSGASSGCEAGQAYNKLPPGTTADQIDPLYIPVPLYGTPAYLQCPATITCIDHPPTIDLSRLGSAVPSLAKAFNVGLPGHDHILTTRNQNQPEWWPVSVIGVTTPQAMAAIETAKSYTAVQALQAQGTVTKPIPTNTFLWFQTLPGVGPTTPGPASTSCMKTLPAGSVVSGAATPDGNGYWAVDRAGDVAAFGDAACYGALTGVHLNAPVVGMAPDRATGGYWLVASDGGVFAFNAPFLGSQGGQHLNRPIVGAAATNSGSGYYMVAADGGVFAYGDAGFYGSTGSITLNKPMVGMSFDVATGGYWLVASDGGVFAYNAPFLGSTGNITLNKPAVSLAPTFDDTGYRVFAADGGVFSYNAPFFGSAGNLTLNQPVVSGVNNNSWDGYYMIAGDGGVFTYGPPGMPFYGSAA